jgi:hypothetical protein
MKYFEEAKLLWQNFVPKSGQADTVQGELIRAVEKLRDEAQRNGNGNWDQGFEMFCSFIADTLCKSGVFDKETQKEIKSDINRIMDYQNPYLEEDLYDRLTDHIVEWYLQNKAPIPREPDPKQFR